MPVLLTWELSISPEQRIVCKENTILCNLGFSSKKPAIELSVEPTLGFGEGSGSTTSTPSPLVPGVGEQAEEGSARQEKACCVFLSLTPLVSRFSHLGSRGTKEMEGVCFNYGAANYGHPTFSILNMNGGGDGKERKLERQTGRSQRDASATLTQQESLCCVTLTLCLWTQTRGNRGQKRTKQGGL